jgi:hypothetical protein
MLCTEAGPGPDAMAAPIPFQLRWRAVLLLLLSHLVAAQPPDPAWPEPGTACAVRQLAPSFAMRQLAAAGPIAAADASTRLARTLALGTNSSGLPPPNDGLCAVPAESLARNSGLTPETAEQQSSFFVSMQGNDSADGTTLASAFRTLQRARDAARKTGGPSSVLVAGGVYFQSAQPLRLGQVDSGTTWRALDNNATVVLSGGVPLTDLHWEKCSSCAGVPGAWQASLKGSQAPPSFASLYVNGRREVRARFPDQGSVPTPEGQSPVDPSMASSGYLVDMVLNHYCFGRHCPHDEKRPFAKTGSGTTEEKLSK